LFKEDLNNIVQNNYTIISSRDRYKMIKILTDERERIDQKIF